MINCIYWNFVIYYNFYKFIYSENGIKNENLLIKNKLNNLEFCYGFQ